MFKFLTALSMLLVSQASFASSVSAQSVRLLVSAGTLIPSAWTVLLPSTLKSVQAISMFNNTASTMKVGIASAGAAAQSEVKQLDLPASSAGVMTALPLSLSGSTRISIRPYDSAGTSSGEVLLNVIYN